MHLLHLAMAFPQITGNHVGGHQPRGDAKPKELIAAKCWETRRARSASGLSASAPRLFLQCSTTNPGHHGPVLASKYDRTMYNCKFIKLAQPNIATNYQTTPTISNNKHV